MCATRSVRVGRAWTVAMVELSARGRSTTPEGRLLAIFAVLDDIFNRADHEARAFVGTLDRVSGSFALSSADALVRDDLRELMTTLAGEAELSNVADLDLSWRVLMSGAVDKAVGGDLDSAKRAGRMAKDLLIRHRPTRRPQTAEAEFDSWVADYEFDMMTRAPGMVTPTTHSPRGVTSSMTDEEFEAWI